MRHYIRSGLILGAAVILLLAVGFVFRLPQATRLWPWADSRLADLFVASILAAVGVPLLWIGATGELGAAAAGALDLMVTYLGAGGYLTQRYLRQGSARLLVAAIVCGVGLIGVAGVYLGSRRIPLCDPRPMPRLARISFAIFALILVAVGIALIRQAAYVFPWPLNPGSSVLYGWIFLGASVYFLHGVCRPQWANTCGQLLGFLAYDLILIGPLVRLFATVRPEHRTSLIVYTAVLGYSAGLALYYLLIDRATRLWPPASTRSAVPQTVERQ